ncbi:helix-turn-helix domain-containing protein, partial [Micromonospora lupini]|uniref:helix-turn-helix domain-containing protein n=1 Tax=Micromonospora lupini TaxID=285679 RepID=UPI00340FD713
MPGQRLSSAERAQIEVLFGQGLNCPQVAQVIGRDRSTVWRELSRNHCGTGGRVPSGQR